MKIGIDARFLGTETGIGRYVEELIKNLEEIDAQNQYFVFLTEKNWEKYEPSRLRPALREGRGFGVPGKPDFHKVKANFRWYSWQEQVFFPFLIRKYKIDLMHFPHFNVPLFCPVPFVVTIHDLILLHHPSTRATRLGFVRFYLKYLFYRLVLKHAILNSKKIFAPSEFTKKDILNNFAAPADKIIVTYEASSLNDVAPANKEFLLQLKITKPYFLTVGNAYPHKNLERLFRIFKKFNSTPSNSPYSDASVGTGGERTPSNSPCFAFGEIVGECGGWAPYPPDFIGGTGGEDGGKFQLVFAGPDDYFYCRLKRYATDLGFEKNEVIMPGKVSDAELKTLYLNAFAYIFPSLYEGFGLPGIEAMSCGTPVLAADRAALPEIYGDAAFYFNPESDEAILDALVRFAGDDKLREHFRAKGLEMAKRYSWEELSAKSLQTYEILEQTLKRVQGDPASRERRG